VEHVYGSWIVEVLVVNCGMQVRRKWVAWKALRCGGQRFLTADGRSPLRGGRPQVVSRHNHVHGRSCSNVP